MRSIALAGRPKLQRVIQVNKLFSRLKRIKFLNKVWNVIVICPERIL